MRRTYTIILTTFLVALFATTGAMAQENGDFRSAADGDWSATATWETFDGTSWVSATAAPDGSENITILDGDSVNVASGTVTITGTVALEGTVEPPLTGGELTVDGGTLVFADGSTYQHDRDEGAIPEATWNAGSTALFTGLVTGEPDDVDQSFHHVVYNNAAQSENISFGWNDYTLGGNITVLNTNGNQFRLSSAGDEGEPARSITIMGDVLVDGENAEFTATGSGDIFDYDITVMGDVEIVNGGFLSVSRGSGGRAVWTLYGDMTINGGEIGDSDIDKHGQTRSFVFAADTASDGVPGQTITANDVSYDSEVYFEVADSSGVLIAATSDFTYEGVFTNYGVVDVDSDATLTFADESTYNHARDGGDIPTATWAEGSTTLITGTEGESPENGNQDFYNLTLDTPNISDRGNLEMNGNTIGGDIHVVNTADNRWYLTSPGDTEADAKEITIMGDVIVEQGAFTTNGSGDPGPIVVQHYGDITVNDANFSISRGSGPLVKWNLHEGSFTFNAGKSQNSDPRNGSAFVFTGEDTVQTFTVGADVDLANLPWTVDSLAYVDMGVSNFGGMSSIIDIKAGATIASADSAAFERNVDAEITTLSSDAHYVINGSEAQKTGFALPLQVASLTIDNEAGVAQSRGITINESLILSAGVFDNTIGFTLGEGANLILDGGSLLIPVDGSGNPILFPEPPYEVGDTLNYNGSFSTAELGATSADGWIIEGTTGSSWEIVNDSGDDDNRALEFNVAVEGTDWYTSQAINEPITVVEGELYEASTYLKADEDGRLVRFYAGMGENGGYERARGWETPQLELTTEYTEYTFEFTATAAQAENGMRLAFEYNVDANDGGTIYIDNTQLVKKMQTVSNEPGDNTLPTQFALSQNYPNPFNPTTTINYDVPEAANVTLQVYDITGRKVAELVDSRKSAGSYSVDWNAENFATGIYIYRLTAGDFSAVPKTYTYQVSIKVLLTPHS